MFSSRPNANSPPRAENRYEVAYTPYRVFSTRGEKTKASRKECLFTLYSVWYTYVLQKMSNKNKSKYSVPKTVREISKIQIKLILIHGIIVVKSVKPNDNF